MQQKIVPKADFCNGLMGQEARGKGQGMDDSVARDPGTSGVAAFRSAGIDMAPKSRTEDFLKVKYDPTMKHVGELIMGNDFLCGSA